MATKCTIIGDQPQETKKKPIEFSQFVRNIENGDLCAGIDHINEVIQSDRNELIKTSLVNL